MGPFALRCVRPPPRPGGGGLCGKRGGEAQLTSSSSSAWQHLGVGLVEDLRSEQRLDLVVVVVVVVIPAIVVCVLELAGRGERARRESEL